MRAMRRVTLVVIACAALSGLAAVALAATGDFDTSFDTNGTLQFSAALAPGAQSYGGGIEPLADGTIVVGGSAEVATGPSRNSIYASWITSTGALDVAYGGDGIERWNASGTSEDWGNALVVDSSVRPIVVGHSTDGGVTSGAIVRFTDTGAVDATFAAAGAAIITSGASVKLNDVALDPSGNIVVVGETGSPRRMLVARLLPSGALDPSFSADGMTTMTFSSPSEAHGVAIQADGRIVIAGVVERAGAHDAELVRLLPSGVFDTTFGGDGRVATAGFAYNDLVLQGDGSIVAAGGASSAEGFADGVRLVRYSTTGATRRWRPGASAQVRIRNQMTDQLNSIAQQPDGRIVGGGYSVNGASPVDSISSWYVVRIRPNGVVDTSFAGDGKFDHSFTSSWPAGEDSAVEGIAVTRTGPILVTGQADDDATLNSLTGVARVLSPAVKRTPRYQFSLTRSSGLFRACGSVITTPCRLRAGAAVYLGGRSWPVPQTASMLNPRPVTISVYRRTAGHWKRVRRGTSSATRDGLFRRAYAGLGRGRYRARATIASTSTTRAGASGYRYVTIV